jgi:serine/threonine-protein kinase RsbW
VSDNGPGFPAGHATIGRRPRPTAAGGRGLWIAQQMTDHLHIDSGPAGTTARISIRESS